MKNRILIIEDNDEIKENLAELLRLEGFEIITAGDGETAVNEINESPPALIICDILMPGLDGYEVLDIVRQNPKTEHIPFIFSSAKSEKKERDKATDLGIDGFFVKPFDFADLLISIKKLLEVWIFVLCIYPPASLHYFQTKTKPRTPNYCAIV